MEKIYAALDMDQCGVINMVDLEDGLAEYCRCSQCQPKFVAQIHAQADEIFEEVDVNGDGAISTDELRGWLLTHGYTESAATEVFRSLDTDGNGELSQEEMRDGFFRYATLRQAVVAVVTTLVKNKRWSPAQQQQQPA